MAKLRNRRAQNGMFCIGGWHRDDFERASKEYESDSYELVAFELDCDGYHWKATYVKTESHDKAYRKGAARQPMFPWRIGSSNDYVM